jgi:uncharacterized membrane protein
MAGLFTVLIFLCALGSGLNGGVFFAFSTFVMAGLARLAPGEGIKAMNAINVTAVTPVFMSLLFGTGVLCAIAIVLALVQWGEPGSVLVLLGSVLYIAGSIAVTRLWNVPLNNALARVTTADALGTAVWTNYLRDWTRWNHVRTVACTVAMALFIVAVWQQASAAIAP